MNQRERPGPDTGSNSLARFPVFATTGRGNLSPLVFAASSDASFWERWCADADVDLRQQALEQARQQGVLCTSQLPATNTPPSRSVLAEVLASQAARDRLEPLNAPPIDPIDTQLDQTQIQAVARALHTPDFALIQGYPGTGKTRVVAELLRQADRLGQRVLFVASSAAALDLALERLASDPALRVLRVLTPDESLDAIPGCVARVSLPGRLRLFQEQTLPAARRALDAARATLAARQRDAQAWAAFEELVDRQDRSREQLNALADHTADLRQAIEADLASSLGSAWHDVCRRHDDAARQIDERASAVRAQLDRLDDELKQCDVQLQGLTPLAEARQSGRWWTGAYWRAAIQGDIQPRVEELQSRCKRSAEEHDALQREADELTTKRRQLDELRAEELGQLIEKEIVRRRADLDARTTQLRQQVEEADAGWKVACESLCPGTTRPEKTCRDAIKQARADWQQQLVCEEQEVSFRASWVEALEQTLPGLSAHLSGTARLIAAPTAAVPVDAGGFDLLVVEEADQIPDPDLLALSRRARRMVLVGEAPLEMPAVPSPRRGSSRTHAIPKPVFERLWQALHPDPRRLEPRWFVADGRLVAQLRHVSHEQQRWFLREPVFDRPEIEVGIVSPPRQEPRVVEVTFPADTPLEEARAYIFGELDELAVQSAGLEMCWREESDAITLLFERPEGPTRVVNLGNGIRELLAQSPQSGEGETGWHSCSLEFDRAAGWDLPAARAWVEQRVGLRDTGRTTLLSHPYRSRPRLARFLRDLLHAGVGNFANATDETLLANLPAIDFVAVPSFNPGPGGRDPRRPDETDLRRTGGGTATLAPRLRAVRGGAGLEADLADLHAEARGVRRQDVLPADLRGLLPPRGVINIPEARAIVAALEDLVSDVSFQAASADWQQRQARLCPVAAGPCGTQGPSPSIAVLALFPSQVALLRLLVQRSTVLARARVPVVIGTPSDMHQRECLVALVGLTRSHTHRAMPFTDHPTSLVRALTRPVSQLVLFGDIGTLVRRSQWHGALDHLDEMAGSAEQTLITQLLAELTEPENARDHNRPAEAEVWAGRPRESSSV